MGIVPPPPLRIRPIDPMLGLTRDLKAIVREDRDLYPGEWFRLARRFVQARRWIRQGYVPLTRPPRGGSGKRPPLAED